MNYQNIFLLVCGLSLASLSKAQINTKGAMIGLFGSSTTIWAIENIRGSAALRRLSNLCNMSEEDLVSTLEISAGLSGLSAITDDHRLRVLRSYAWRIPVIMLVAGFVTSKTFKNFIKLIPIIGRPLGGCSSIRCKGSCDNCKGRTVVLVAGFYALMKNQLDEFGRSVENKWNTVIKG